MTYLLDTNAWIVYLNQRSTNLVRRIGTTAPMDIRLCSIVKAELYWGAYRSPRPSANLATLAALFSRFSSFDFEDRAADIYGTIRAKLASLGTPIGPNDLMIAAIALATDVTLVTHNTREFSRIPHLKLEDWEL